MAFCVDQWRNSFLSARGDNKHMMDPSIQICPCQNPYSEASQLHAQLNPDQDHPLDWKS